MKYRAELAQGGLASPSQPHAAWARPGVSCVGAFGPLNRPIRGPASLDGREIELLHRRLVLGEAEFPQGEEVLADVQPLQAAVGAIPDFMRCVDTELSEVLGDL